jgi:hypothetical protein
MVFKSLCCISNIGYASHRWMEDHWNCDVLLMLICSKEWSLFNWSILHLFVETVYLRAKDEILDCFMIQWLWQHSGNIVHSMLQSCLGTHQCQAPDSSNYW